MEPESLWTTIWKPLPYHSGNLSNFSKEVSVEDRWMFYLLKMIDPFLKVVALSILCDHTILYFKAVQNEEEDFKTVW